MKIIQATTKDVNQIMEIIEHARTIMRANGNTTQWTNGYPSKEIIFNDIEYNHGFVCLENDYIYGSFIETNRFTEITNQFQYSKGNTNGYAPQFLASGNYQFPNNLNGNGYVIFEYSGTKTITTTIQIDHIRFW